MQIKNGQKIWAGNSQEKLSNGQNPYETVLIYISNQENAN